MLGEQPTGIPTPSRNPELNRECEGLDKVIAGLSSVVQLLETRLKPALDSREIAEKSPSEAENEPSTEIGKAIKEFRDRVKNEIKKIRDILDRLEI